MATNTWIELPQTAVGGGGITSINGAVGPAITLVAGAGVSISTLVNSITISNTGVSGTANTFAGFDGTGDLYTVPGFVIDTTSGGMNENITVNPNNNIGSFLLNSTYLNITPLQNSPNDTWNALQTQINLDVGSTGFSQGTSGVAAVLFNNYFSHQGTGDIGSLSFLTNSYDIGNGTDPITFKGMSYSYGFGQVHANVTIDGSLQGYGFQPNVNAAAIGTSNFNIQAFYDAPNIGITVNGYTGYSSNPTLFAISNNANYTGFNINPGITTLTGNAGITGVAIGGSATTIGATSNIIGVNFNTNLTTMGASAGMTAFNANNTITTMGATSNYNGVSISPVITTSHGSINGLSVTPQISGGDASFKGLNIAPSGGATLTDPIGIDIQLVNILSTNPQGIVGFQSDSRLQINATTQLMATQTFQIGSRIENFFTVPAGSPVTGTDEIGVNIAGDLAAQDDVANGAFGIGFNSVGFIASLGVATTKTVDTVTVFLPACALPDPGFTTGGSITEFHILRSFPPLPQGGTVSITNAYFLKLDSVFGGFSTSATNAWGLYLQDLDLNNYIEGKLSLGVTTCTTNSKLTVNDGHITSLQTTSPTISADTNAGTGASASLSNATDTAGFIELTLGSGAFSAGTQLTVTFNKSYATAPIVVFSAANDRAAQDGGNNHHIYSPAASTTSFTIAFGQTPNTAGAVYQWQYHVIETQ